MHFLSRSGGAYFIARCLYKHSDFLLNHSVDAPSLACAMHVHEAVDEAITTHCPGLLSSREKSVARFDIPYVRIHSSTKLT